MRCTRNSGVQRLVPKMKLQGLHALSSTPAEFAGLLASEVDHWAKVIPSIGIQPE